LARLENQRPTGVALKMRYLGVVAIAILLSLFSNRFWAQAKPGKWGSNRSGSEIDGLFPISAEMCQQAPSMVGMAQDGAACMAFMPAWTYDASKNACSEFVFGGCGGNSNQFSSRDECEKACKD